MDKTIAEIVREYGWYAAIINDADPPFVYTIGLMTTWGHPELILFGLDPDNAYALLSGLIADIRAGKQYSRDGVCTVDLGGEKYQVGFRRVHSTQHPLYLGFAMGFLRNIGRIGELEAMQVFWPDSTGKFPFEVGCDLGVFNVQPRVDIGLTAREVAEFERQWE